MSRYNRQKYRDVVPSEVDPEQFPITQLKFDGIWGGVEASETGELRYYSRNGQLKKVEQHAGLPPGFYIGEFMYGSEWSTKNNRAGKLFLFDITELNGTSLTNHTYAERHNQLLQIKHHGQMPAHWHVVANYSTLQCDAIWRRFVETTEFEGLVFRNPSHTWHVDILRAKLGLSEDLRVVGFESGLGKNDGSLGALVGVCDAGVWHSIGGGLTNNDRREIWSNQQAFLGKVFTVSYKKKFDSGKLRHPNFEGWHSDKE